jgi:hypothetical protein
MAFASAVLMFADSPQMFFGVVTAQDSLFLFTDMVSVTDDTSAVKSDERCPRWLTHRGLFW